MVQLADTDTYTLFRDGISLSKQKGASQRGENITESTWYNAFLQYPWVLNGEENIESFSSSNYAQPFSSSHEMALRLISRSAFQDAEPQIHARTIFAGCVISWSQS